MGTNATTTSKTIITKMTYSVENTKGLVDNRANIPSLIRRNTTWLAVTFAVSCMPRVIGLTINMVQG